MKTRKDVDSYIASAAKEAQPLLQQMRTAIQKAVPEAQETIAYGIPTYKLNGNLVHFGAFKDHVSFFPTASGVAAFSKELAKYKISRGTIQFPLENPLPIGLIKKIVIFRVKESQAKKKRLQSTLRD